MIGEEVHDHGGGVGGSGVAVSTQVRMANDIAAQFRHLPHDQAVAALAGHLRSFWEPRMRRQLAEHVAAGGEGLDPLVIEAAAGLG
jgi:formate dehydrogenase subunit delta